MIGIVTVYKSNNCGSFWQAFCLQETIKSLGCECGMVEYKPSVKLSPAFYEITHILASILKFRPRVALRQIRKWIRFCCERKRFFNIVQEEECSFFVIGSDTLWNVNDYYFDAMISYYTGNEFHQKPFAVFGTSAGQASNLQLNKYNSLFQTLLKAKHIFVRDQNTANSLRTLIGLYPDVVCDPTLLVDKRFFLDFLNKTKPIKKDEKNNRFLLLYIFGGIEKKTSMELESFALSHDLSIITLDKAFDFAKEIVVAGPTEFLYFFSKAMYIVTDTFHGTVFSTIFEKQFVVLDQSKAKINDYLNGIKLYDRLLKNGDSISALLERSIDYEVVNNKLGILRNDSIQKLRMVVKNDNRNICS